MTSSNGNIFRVTGPLCGEFTGHRWIPLTKASDAELWCFVWSAHEHSVAQTIETLVIWSAHYDFSVIYICIYILICFPQSLRLDYNAISLIDEEAFRNTTTLKNLYISHNLLVSLPPIQDLADTLINLKVTNNQIQMIPDLYFASCTSLISFEVTANNLTMINERSFSGLASIRKLILRYNMIEDTVDNIIWNLRTLTHLYLDGNKLTRLPSLALNGSPKLRRLSVADNKITGITENQMRDVYRLDTLNISYTLITELDFIYGIKGVIDFYASSTAILFTETLFDDQQNLRSLEMSDIRLVTFPLLSGSKRSIKKIDLSHNEIQCVDVQHLANMTNLRYLNLEYNNISGFPDIGCKDGNNFTNPWADMQFPSLEEFRLDNNQVTNLQSDILINMPGLQLLHASFNEIKYMPFLSAVGAPLTHVYLDHNIISYIEEEHIFGLSSLQTLQLSHNDIAYLSLFILANLNSLKLFDLRYNKLMTPPILTINNLSPSMEILLTHNPYACDSRMCLLENDALLMDGLLCNTPSRIAGRSIQSFIAAMYCGK